MQDNDNVRVFNIRRLEPEHLKSLISFFEILVVSESNKTFHPHDFDKQTAYDIVNQVNHSKDLYYVMDLGFDRIIAYGILRGWDEGYDIPSLGIAVHPDYRGLKLSKIFMEFLHTASKLRGATKVMLRVYKNNTVAKNLYEKLGYKFTDLTENEVRGYYDL